MAHPATEYEQFLTSELKDTLVDGEQISVTGFLHTKPIAMGLLLGPLVMLGKGYFFAALTQSRLVAVETRMGLFPVQLVGRNEAQPSHAGNRRANTIVILQVAAVLIWLLLAFGSPGLAIRQIAPYCLLTSGLLDVTSSILFFFWLHHAWSCIPRIGRDTSHPQRQLCPSNDQNFRRYSVSHTTPACSSENSPSSWAL